LRLCVHPALWMPREKCDSHFWLERAASSGHRTKLSAVFGRPLQTGVTIAHMAEEKSEFSAPSCSGNLSVCTAASTVPMLASTQWPHERRISRRSSETSERIGALEEALGMSPAFRKRSITCFTASEPSRGTSAWSRVSRHCAGFCGSRSAAARRRRRPSQSSA
jgi:hypothetical protein